MVSDHQDLINDPNIGDKGIDGDSVVKEATAIYTKNTGAPPITARHARARAPADQALIDSMREVVDEHEAEIDMPGIGFKGFIPAVYGRLVSERFDEKVGTEALMKVTAPEDLVRNRKALPDGWEKSVIEAHFLQPGLDEGRGLHRGGRRPGRPAFRMLMPEYYSASCLTCHGEPDGRGRRDRLSEGGRARRAISAGAISITLFK